MMSIVVGNFDYFGVPFPVVMADRYFHIPKTAFGFNIDVFRWDDITREHYYEVMYGRPIPENIANSPNAVINYKQITPGIHIYKFLAKPGIAQICGKKTINKEISIKLDKQEITVFIDNVKITSFTPNQVEGPIGLKIYADGSHVFGVGRLPDGMEIKRGFFIKQ